MLGFVGRTGVLGLLLVDLRFSSSHPSVRSGVHQLHRLQHTWVEGSTNLRRVDLYPDDLTPKENSSLCSLVVMMFLDIGLVIACSVILSLIFRCVHACIDGSSPIRKPSTSENSARCPGAEGLRPVEKLRQVDRRSREAVPGPLGVG